MVKSLIDKLAQGLMNFMMASTSSCVMSFRSSALFFLCDVFSLLGTLLHDLLVLFGDDDRGGLLRPGAHVDDDQCDDGDGRDDGDSVGLHTYNYQLFFSTRLDTN